eukprot:jgi/Chlat1/3164/Chrsp219S08794
MLLTKFDYSEMVLANRILTPLLFFAFVFFCFMLLSMFLAIVADSFADVKTRETKEAKQLYSHLRETLVARVQPAVGLKTVVPWMDNFINESANKRELKGNAAAYWLLLRRGPKDLLMKYDVTANEVLYADEMDLMPKDLVERGVELKNKLKANKDKDKNEGEASDTHKDSSQPAPQSKFARQDLNSRVKKRLRRRRSSSL